MTNWRKYLVVVKLTLEEYFVYRLNFILWRFRSLLGFLTLFVFWHAVYQDKDQLFGYDAPQMIAYVVGVALLRAVVTASRSADLAGQIKSGELSRYLIQPYQVFVYLFSRDVADKSLNILFSIVEILLVLTISQVAIFIPTHLINVVAFLLISFLAAFLYFLVSLSLSLTGFWTEDVWATRWLFGIIILELFSGSLFPLDVLPIWLQRLTNLTPFPYLIYYPVKVLISPFSVLEFTRVVLIMSGWSFCFYLITTTLWHRGIKRFGAYGN